MKALKLIVLALVTGMALQGCTNMPPDPNVSKPWVAPDGTVVQPPPGGWPSYDKGGENGGSGGRN